MTYSITAELKDFISLSPHIKRLLKTACAIIMISEMIKIFPPFLFKQIVDLMVVYDPAKGISLELVGWLLAGYFGAMITTSLLDTARMRFLYTQIFNSETDVISTISKKLLSLDISFHETHNTGANMSKIYRGSSRLSDIMFHLVDTVIPIICQSIVTIVIFFWMSWEVGLSYLLFIPIFIYLLKLDVQATQPYRKRLQESFDTFAGTLAQSVSNIRTVKDFNAEDKEFGKAKTSLNKYLQAHNLRNIAGLRASFAEEAFVALARVATLSLGVWLMVHQRITPGSLVFLVTLSEKAYINLQRTYRVYYLLQDAAPSIERFKEINEQRITVKDNPTSKLRIHDGEVNFGDASFEYTKGTAAIDHVSFEIPARSVTALVGRSGGGKSTVAKLSLRHFDPSSGAILIDGHDIREYSLKSLRGAIGLVSQDVELFNESVHDNIAYGVSHGTERASRKEVIQAAKLAHAHEFISKLSKGYDALIGERGVRLSGGQKQRLAIARSLVKKPKILIFDEATSSLDAESERLVHSAIQGLMGRVTLIIIAHRFATIERADKIILLENGRVAEIGTHKELAAKKGIFAKLRKLQELGEVG